MTFRQLVGFALFLLGAWMTWQACQSVFLYAARGPGLAETLQDPAFAIPLARGAMAVIGGGLALLNWPGGALFAALSTLAAGALAGAILASGGDRTLWMPNALYLGGVALLFLVLAFSRRENA